MHTLVVGNEPDTVVVQDIDLSDPPAFGDIALETFEVPLPGQVFDSDGLVAPLSDELNNDGSDPGPDSGSQFA